MNLNKNINVDASDCKSCEPLGTLTISPTLLTDREVTYGLNGHGVGDEESVSPNEVDAKISKAIQDALASANAYTNEQLRIAINSISNLYKRIRYEIVSKPEGTLVDYRDNEIRVMCPADTKWVKQNVGATGNANMYYMGFRAYAPAGAVSFREGDRGVLLDEVYTFDDDFAGTDEYGRNYSICWLALASYDDSTGEWTYFGKNSSEDRYIGWTYIVEWYDENGAVLESDAIRINLANESCYHILEPSYLTNFADELIEETKVYTDEQIQKILESVEDASDEDIENLFKTV